MENPQSLPAFRNKIASKEQISNFVKISHKLKLISALAGSLKIDDLATVYSSGTDIIGMRGAACTFEDRLNGKITRKNVRHIVTSLINIKKQP